MFAALILTAVQAATPAAAPPQDPELAQIAARLVDDSGAPGAAVMRTSGGAVVIGTAGVRAVGTEAAIATDDLWHIGSDTKAMTATLVARLAEQGVVDWDDTIGDRLGGVVETIDPAYRDLTFRHLLSHRAGLAPNPGLVDMMRFAMSEAPLTEQRLRYAAVMLGRPPAAEPETAFLYSNAGYVVAGAMLEQATGTSWEALMEREVFDPLGMTSAGFGAPGSTRTVDQPRGHRPGLFGRLGAVEPGPRADNPAVMGPAGTVHVSMRDLAGFLTLHATGEAGGAADYLSAQSFAILHTPPFGGDYAMGWGVDGAELTHAGSNTMWFVLVSADRETGEARAVGVNDGRTEDLLPPAQAAMAALQQQGFSE